MLRREEQPKCQASELLSHVTRLSQICFSVQVQARLIKHPLRPHTQ
jgi:hypothetical protein